MSKGPSYTWMAFNNVLNYAFLAGSAAFAVWQFPTLGWVPLAVAGAAEALWLTVGARTGTPRRYFDFVHTQKQKQLGAGQMQDNLRGLTETDRERYQELQRLRTDIHEQVASNPSMTMELVKGELTKIDQLLETYLRLAQTAARYEHYVETSDLNQIEAEVRRQDKIVERAEPEQRALARKNLDVLQKRLQRAIDIRKQIRTARGQLNLIDNTFRLIRDQIITMESPAELSDQLDELTSAVDSIEAADKETEALVRKLDKEIAALRS